MIEVYIGIGSNMGDRRANIQDALRELAQKTTVLRQSSLYETEPEGYAEQRDFLNCVVSVETDMKPSELLVLLKDIEKRAGRVESFRNAPRAIDLDILLYDDEVVNEPGLQVPHPRLQERAFVLVPMAEIASGRIHPTLHKPMFELLAELNAGKRVKKWGRLPDAARS